MSDVTRAELATVFKTPRLIKAFETLLNSNTDMSSVTGSLVNGGLLVTALVPALEGQRVLTAGVGIGLRDGGAGNDLQVRILATAVAPGVYGAAGRPFSMTVDTYGRVTGATQLSGVYRLRVSAVSVPTASQVVYEDVADVAYILPANLAGAAWGSCGTAATASYVFTLLKNGAACGTVTYAAGSTGTPTFATSGGVAVSFAVGDVFTVQGQVTPDATLARVRFKIVGAI